MKLNVSEALRNPGQEYVFRGEQTIAPVEIGGETVTFDAADVAGTYFTAEDGSVTVDGSVTTVAHARCANCLEPASADIAAPFRETFARGGDPEDDETFYYEGYRVDLEKLVMSYAVLNLPMRFLCREDCPGFAVMNDDQAVDETCLCQKELPGQHPFAALQQLLMRDEESADSPSCGPDAPDSASGAKKDEEV